MKKKFTAEENDFRRRLDLFLAFKNDDWSRSFVKKQIEENHVKVNGEVEYRAARSVETGDKVEIEYEPVKKRVEAKPEKIPLDIVYEDEDLVVVNKPAGMVVHPANGNWSGTLINALLYHFKEFKSVGQKIRYGLVHRLDKDTSGLVLIGKTNKGLWFYSRKFAEREVEKRYLALVRMERDWKSGNAKRVGKWFEVTSYLGRKRKDWKRMGIAGKSEGKFAKTRFGVLERVGDKALLEVEPLTGRMHQIRVHLAFVDLPIVGDDVYGVEIFRFNSPEQKLKKVQHRDSGTIEPTLKPLSRPMLHAWKLRVTLLNGEEKNFVALLPEDFRGVLEQLGFEETGSTEEH